MFASSTDNKSTPSGVAGSKSPQLTTASLEIDGIKANVQRNSTTVELGVSQSFQSTTDSDFMQSEATQARNSKQDTTGNDNEKNEPVLARDLSEEGESFPILSSANTKFQNLVAFPTTNGKLNEEQLEDLTSSISKLSLPTMPSASSISSQVPEHLLTRPAIKRRNSAEHDFHGYCAGQFDESIPSRNRAGSIQNYNPSVATPVDHLAREIDSGINHLARWVHQLRSMQLQGGAGFDAGIVGLKEQMGVDPLGEWAAQLHFALGLVRDMKADSGKEPLSDIIEKKH